MRTEPATNNVTDYGVKKAVENLPQLREKLAAICDNYLSIQRDILESFVDRGQLRMLAQPTVLTNGKRIPGLKLDHPRQLALMHALVRFAHVAAGNTFCTCELHAPVAEAWDALYPSTGSLHCATICPSSELKAWLTKFLIQAVTACFPKATS